MLGLDLTRKTTRSRLILAAIIAIAAGAAGLFAREAPPDYPIESADRLQGISSLDMTQLGWTFHKLDPLYSPGITRAEVEKMAKAAGFSGGASVQESILTRVVVADVTPRIDRAAWVVNFDPAQVQDMFVPGSTKLALAIYDAATGEFILAHTVKAPPPDGYQRVPLPSNPLSTPTPTGQ